jgi:hypothetical protein
VGACVAKVELFISALPDGVDQPVLRTPVTRVPCGVEAAAAELERYNEEANALAQSIAASCAGCGMQLSTCVPPPPQPLSIRVGAGSPSFDLARRHAGESSDACRLPPGGAMLYGTRRYAYAMHVRENRCGRIKRLLQSSSTYTSTLSRARLVSTSLP